MSREPELQPEVLRVEVHCNIGEAIVVLGGEFDMSGTRTFWAHVSEALATRPQSITVEAAGLEFIDSSGLLALMRARDAATEAGVGFRVSEASSAFRRVVELTGAGGLLPD
jgi:anti-sigma B factor antagonist